MSDPALILDDLSKIRQSRRSAAVAEYRQAVEGIASGHVTPAELGSSLDDVMVRLSISDSDLATDVGVLRDIREYQQRIDDFDANRSEHDERSTKAEAALSKLNEEYRTFRQRHDDAEQDVRAAGAPFGRANKARKKIDKLERTNPRMFDSRDTILTTGSAWSVGDEVLDDAR